MNSNSTTAFEPINKCVRIQADGVYLLGDLQIPEESHAIIIFVYAGDRPMNNPRCLHAARILRNKGFATLLCNLLTEDEEGDDEATERYRNDAALIAKRLVGVTRWVQVEPDTRALPIGYLGACAGGAAAAIAAAELGDVVSTIVSRGGRMTLAAESLPRLTCPILMIVGENDTEGLGQNHEAMKMLTCENELRIISGASRLFGEPGKLEEMATAGGDWFRAHMGASKIGT